MIRLRTMLSLFIILQSFVAFATSELPYMEDRLGIPEVSQREYIVANAHQYDFVQTYGMATCVALVLFDTDSNQVFLAHIDAAVNLKRELPRALKNFSTDIQALLIGGQDKLANKIRETLKEMNYDSFLRIPKVENITVSLRTGEVFEYDESKVTTDWRVSQAKMDRLHFGGKRLFRHQDSIGGGDFLELSEESPSHFPIPNLGF
ncbi:hypothetical protein [Bacteriovorax sp. DB6_IX]|uniref:hypothetical protein n=1 Tax=Bacteriovorax sp. DB6_IX TaxID=1353530 RepID=UPI0012F7ECD9|nr:hypothetical protein [Bacteriovorax sp. DB6_IX]